MKILSDKEFIEYTDSLHEIIINLNKCNELFKEHTKKSIEVTLDNYYMTNSQEIQYKVILAKIGKTLGEFIINIQNLPNEIEKLNN